MTAKIMGITIELRLMHLRPWSVRGLHLAEIHLGDSPRIVISVRGYVHAESAHPAIGIGECLGGYLGTV